jgi:glycyl-tRNA synthetase (class II)
MIVFGDVSENQSVLKFKMELAPFSAACIPLRAARTISRAPIDATPELCAGQSH